MTTVTPLTEAHCEALVRFFADLPEGDRTFIREDVTDPDVVRGWTAGSPGVDRWVAVDDGGRVLGYVAVQGHPPPDAGGAGHPVPHHVGVGHVLADEGAIALGEVGEETQQGVAVGVGQLHDLGRVAGHLRPPGRRRCPAAARCGGG